MRFASYTNGGDKYYGAITDEGMVALNDDFPQWPTLLDAKGDSTSVLIYFKDHDLCLISD